MFIDCRKGVRPDVILNEYETRLLQDSCRSIIFHRDITPINYPTITTDHALIITIEDSLLITAFYSYGRLYGILQWHDFYKILNNKINIYISKSAYKRLAYKHPEVYRYIRKLDEFNITPCTFF